MSDAVTSSVAQFERDFVRPNIGRTLIVGAKVYRGRTDRRAGFKFAVGVDMLPGDGVDVVADLEESAPDIGLFDHVECMSVLEHSRRPWVLASNLERMMAPGATLFVTVPFCWRVHGYPSDFWRFTPDALPLLFPAITWGARMLAGSALREDQVKAMKVDGFPYFERTETVGFGRMP